MTHYTCCAINHKRKVKLYKPIYTLMGFLLLGVERIFLHQPYITLLAKQKTPSQLQAKRLILLVAGAGFEPTTFGL